MPPVSQLMVPLPVKSVPDSSNVGAELTGKLNKEEIMKWLAKFYQRREIKAAAVENGIDNYIYHQTYLSFRKFCLEDDKLPVDLHVTLSDIIAGACHLDSLLPYFIRHAKQAFPHLECLDDLKKISDLRLPANWYPEARALTRKIVFHSGPTNSGKTYHALERFFNSKSGVYCGPLKLLASEVYYKSNQRGVPCDLVTGEERNFANATDKSPSSHVSCTVEMVSVNTPYEVAVIDEIQMLKDPSRGWAWTRALLGVVAEEVHVCGEAAAIDVVKEILMSASEEIEMRRYKRLTELIIEDASLGTLDKIRPGDCLVCFNKQDIFWSMRQIEAMGIECAVIYGSLPPGTKLAQAKKFNDPDHPCKVLVATDAIGMGLNLNIGRVIFNSLIKPTTNEKGEKEMDTISTSQALQIAGRAGRYGTQFSTGYVTTLKNEDLPTLKRLLSQHPEPINQVGLHPTAEQIELYAYHLPHANLSNLIDIFVNLSTLDDSLYFICNINDFKFLADMIQHVPLPLRARYVFCCAPINRKIPFVCSMFLKFARQYSRNEVLSFDWLGRQIGLPFSCPNTLLELVHLESVFDVLDLYLWLSYRFQDLFPDASLVRDMQKELDCLIQTGVAQLTRLLINSETGVSSGTSQAVEAEENQHVPSAKKTPYFHNAVNIVNSISSHGRIADRLLSEGLLTPKLLEDLKTEWQREKDNETAQETVSTVTSPIITKRSKNEMFKAVKRINRKRVK
uniref:ATP-dependent RNA helicase SUV3 homolog, mitochondrial n=1 Tax=Daphnia pulex TaxID=6669 RepID=A0A4Y7MPK4_DAPPU|nr:EOG090X01V1 [Daphnia pulex]